MSASVATPSSPWTDSTHAKLGPYSDAQSVEERGAARGLSYSARRNRPSSARA